MASIHTRGFLQHDDALGGERSEEEQAGDRDADGDASCGKQGGDGLFPPAQTDKPFLKGVEQGGEHGGEHDGMQERLEEEADQQEGEEQQDQQERASDSVWRIHSSHSPCGFR